MIFLRPQPETRRCAILIFENLRSRRDERLPCIVRLHFNATRLVAALQPRENVIVEHELPLEDSSHNFSGQVIFGRAETADGDENRRAIHGAAIPVTGLV